MATGAKHKDDEDDDEQETYHTKKEREEKEKVESDARAAAKALIQANILSVLGKPPNFLRVIVNHLWDNRYRANIYVEKGNGQVIAHSYFVVYRAAKVPQASSLFSPPLIPTYVGKGQYLGKVASQIKGLANG